MFEMKTGAFDSCKYLIKRCSSMDGYVLLFLYLLLSYKVIFEHRFTDYAIT